mmetsp:Transcript_4982/g.11074  ORF Transcript_4982/g.11074 Transcript_4982/m.11074 type:complete len:219 (+) Transcript_4982:121-777(+)|eukprot:CAMPEP_0168166652 /NCGR_PEP_ID=MMETSP0139_2-20121125/2142_1 /TAXON_ID=44445 /ORGANISM="Pseudo-nitzschia australis, Strain 10249 10 AB" /LENGTH=218 /DNA_ID=CAMNT_0008083865 /DNA_START=64 /DNA_END=720 /DNA_ORIENTATION=+
MNFSLLAIAAVMASSTEAFTANLSVRRATSMMAVTVNSDQLVAEALELSNKFGATSKEARLAWEAVEEVNASDNSVATMGSLNEECEVEVVSQDCLEYNAALEEMQELLLANKPKMASLSDDIAKTISNVKLAAPNASAAPQSQELQTALSEARLVSEKEGLGSPAAAVAWETVEEIAAAGSTNAVGGKLTDDECFVEAAQEACAALEELNRIIENRN